MGSESELIEIGLPGYYEEYVMCAHTSVSHFPPGPGVVAWRGQEWAPYPFGEREGKVTVHTDPTYLLNTALGKHINNQCLILLRDGASGRAGR